MSISPVASAGVAAAPAQAGSKPVTLGSGTTKASEGAEAPAPAAKAQGSSTTVSISAAARAAALQEASETPAQTAAEARNGDHQAQRLAAKAEAAKANATPAKPA